MTEEKDKKPNILKLKFTKKTTETSEKIDLPAKEESSYSNRVNELKKKEEKENQVKKVENEKSAPAKVEEAKIEHEKVEEKTKYSKFASLDIKKNISKGMPQIVEKQPSQRPQFGRSAFQRPRTPGNYQRPEGSQSQDGRFQRPEGGGYQRPEGGYQRPNNYTPNFQRPEGSQGQDGRFQRPHNPNYQRPEGGYQRPEGGGFQRPYRPNYQRPEGAQGQDNRFQRPEGSGGYQRPEGGGFQRPYRPNYQRPEGAQGQDNRFQRPYTPGNYQPAWKKDQPGGAPFQRPFRTPYNKTDQSNPFVKRNSDDRFKRDQPVGGPGRPNTYRPNSGGFAPSFVPQDNLTKRNQFSPDQKKKKQYEKDDKSKNSGYKQKENDGSKINTTYFVGRVDSGRLEDDQVFNEFGIRKKHKDRSKESNVFIKRDVKISQPMSFKELASALAIRVNELIAIAKQAGLSVDLKELIQEDIIHILVEESGHNPIRIDEQNKSRLEFPVQDLDLSKAKVRPPIVVVVGHVDHGKTSLLDCIRKTRVAKKEAGGITQNIGAYQVQTKDGAITFIDTPGHEAFTSMRSRGVKITDIAILVIAADESVKPQTIEAIAHVKAANTPMIVAITKCDLPSANVEKVKQDLLQHEIVASEFGGDVSFVSVSAQTNHNIDKLLELILLQAEMMDLKANEDCEARGVVLESRMNPKIGPVATLLVQQGVLTKSFCMAGIASGKIKSIVDDMGKQLISAGPSLAVEVVGFDIPPAVGAEFACISDSKVSSDILKARKEKFDQENKSTGGIFDLDSCFKEPLPGINLILRSDTQGSLEALKLALSNLSNEKTEVNFIFSGVGPIKETDIDLAKISQAQIIAFNIKNTQQVKSEAKDKKIEIIENDVIYRLIEAVEQQLLGLIKPEEHEVFVGSARVQQIFTSSKLGNIAGSIVINGLIKRNLIAKVIRNEKVLATDLIAGLKRNKDDAKEVKNGLECGILLKDFKDFKVGDEIHCYKMEVIS